MFSTSPARRPLKLAAAAAIAGLCLAGAPSLVATATPAGSAVSTADAVGDPPIPAFLSGTEGGGADVDNRTGRVTPRLAQKKLVDRMDARVTWNRFGTPASLINDSGYLSKRFKGSNVTAARTWLRKNAALFRMSRGDVAGLQLLNDAALSGSGGHAVTFRQTFGGLPATQDGMIIVGVRRGKVAYVSSSAAGTQAAPDQSGLMDAREAWIRAAGHLGIDKALADVGDVRTKGDWTVFPVEGLVTPAVGKERIDQRARLVAFPTFTEGVKAAYEVNVLDNQPGKYPVGSIVYVDAKTGALLFRQNAVDTFAQGAASAVSMAPHGGSFTGDYPTSGVKCGPLHDIPVDAANRTLVATAYPVVAFNDIRLIVRDPSSTNRGESDVTGTGVPEQVVIDLDPVSGEAGTWTAQVCESANPVAQSVPPTNYTGSFFLSDQQSPTDAFAFPPQWNFFTSTPALPDRAVGPPFDYPDTDNRAQACWTTQDPGAPATCDIDLTPNQGDSNLASRVPWDHNVQSNLPNFMTYGNNALTAEAWNAAITPGSFSQRPVDFDRTYGFGESGDPQSPTGELEDWTNSWNKNRCDYLAAQTPAQNNLDVLAATTTLHAGHNRFHDFAYRLGFTERNYNLQMNNFGNTQPGPFPGGREEDPEIGNVQNGATLPTELGLTRDNANQLTLQDGIPGITNQYLFQPIAGGFYAPCTDGDLDAAIYGHEFTHAISNRMVGGPDSNLSGAQAGAMGESWSDQVAVEYLNAYGYVPTSKNENPFAVGVYATGNKKKAIRNYALNDNPLNYSNIGFDFTCEGTLVGPPVEPECEDPESEVHSDGEVWNGIGYEVRQALVNKYNKKFPYSNRALQVKCADGNLPAEKCPGNRRWIQIMFDAFLLQQADTSMLTARDAYLAADRMRFGGANQKELWAAFARRGMGSKASTKGTDDDNPKPSFESPLSKEAKVKFRPLGMSDKGQVKVPGTLYVGDYEARTTPVAVSNPKSNRLPAVRMVPGTYHFLFVAKGYGMTRYTLKIKKPKKGHKKVVQELHLSANMASKSNGAVIDGASNGVNPESLIDDTETTNWGGVSPTGVSVDESHPYVNVNLGGGAQMVRAVKVSAMLRPVPDKAADADPNAGSRFTALRKFAIETCTEDSNTDCSGSSASYKRIFTSPDNAFNAVIPRPVIPDLRFQRFDVPDTRATHVRLVVLENQCSGYEGYAGEQDNDPTNSTDCKTVTDRDEFVHAAELEVFSFDSATRPPGDPVVLMLMKSDPLLVASPGDTIKYTMTYTNLGPEPASHARITIGHLPVGLTFVRSNEHAIRDGARLVWRLGKVGVEKTGTLRFTAKVAPGTPLGTLLLTQAQFTGSHTFSPPAAALNVVGP
jgi:extracellular elastinolytic metalloproteinase